MGAQKYKKTFLFLTPAIGGLEAKKTFNFGPEKGNLVIGKKPLKKKKRCYFGLLGQKNKFL